MLHYGVARTVIHTYSAPFAGKLIDSRNIAAIKVGKFDGPKSAQPGTSAAAGAGCLLDSGVKPAVEYSRMNGPLNRRSNQVQVGGINVAISQH
jgi:hypothetical protein